MSPPSQPLFAQLASSGSAVVATQVLRLALRFGSMITLARLLTPNQFGIFGMAALVYGLLQSGRDLGLATVAVQEGELTPSASTRFFWLQCGAGLLVTALTAALAPLAAMYFEQPALTAMLWTLGGAFILSGLGGQFRVELSRALRFRAISIVEAAGLATGFGVAIALAARGAGHWALVAMVLVQELVTLAGLVAAGPWRPQGRPDFTGAGGHLFSGLHLTGFNMTMYATQMIDQACVAARFGSHALGLYGRAWQLGTLPTHGLIAGLSNWMVQGLVKLRDQPEAFSAWCRRILNALAWLCAPLAAVLVVAPEPILRVLLGPQWSEAAPALRWLALTLPIQPWLFAELWILTACREERRLLGWSLVRFGVLAGALSWGGATGFTGVALTVTIVQWLLLPVSVLVVGAVSPARWTDLVQASLCPLLLGVLTGVALQFSRALWSGQSGGLAAALIALIVLLVTAGFAALSTRGRRELTAAIQLLLGRAV